MTLLRVTRSRRVSACFWHALGVLLVTWSSASCYSVYVAPPLAAKPAGPEQKIPAGFAATGRPSFGSKVTNLVISADGAHIAWVADARQTTSGMGTLRVEGHSVVVRDGVVQPPPYFKVEGLRFVPGENTLVYKAAVVRDNVERWRIVLRGREIVGGFGGIGELLVLDGFLAAVLNANSGIGLRGRNYRLLVNGRTMSERYAFVRKDIAALLREGKACFAASRDLGSNRYAVFCSGSDVPVMDGFEVIVGPSAEPESGALFFGGKKAGRFALYRNDVLVEGDYDEMRRPVVVAGSVAYAARTGSEWSLFVNGKRLMSDLDSIGEIAISRDGKQVACAADRGDGTRLFLDGRAVSDPMLYIDRLSFSAEGPTLVAVGTAGERSGNMVSDLRHFVLANGARVSPVFSGMVAYACTEKGLRYAGFHAWDQNIVAGTIEHSKLPKMQSRLLD
jgi:hypothetical protein